MDELRKFADALETLPNYKHGTRRNSGERPKLYFDYTDINRCLVALGNAFDPTTGKFRRPYGENDEEQFAAKYGVSENDAKALNYGELHRLKIGYRDDPSLNSTPKKLAAVLRKLAAKYEAA